jgi:histidine ammonia-lyase
VESDASHAPQAVSQLERSVPAARAVVAAELLAAVRAAHRSERAVTSRFAAVFAVAKDAPDDLSGLLEHAQRLLTGE